MRGAFANAGGDGKEDAINLGILINEHQRVRDVVVTFGWVIRSYRAGTKRRTIHHMNHRRADPCADALLSTVKDSVHHTRRLWTGRRLVKVVVEDFMNKNQVNITK